MPPRPVVTPLRSRAAPPGYTDTAALNDIHALLTAGDPGDAALADVAQILARTGRPMVAARDIEVSAFHTALGWPVACTDAGDTTVFVRQAPAGHGLQIEICTTGGQHGGDLTVTLDGRELHPARHADDAAG